MGKFSNNNRLSLEFMKANKKASRKVFEKHTGLGERYYYRARQLLEINTFGTDTKLHRIAEYIEKNPETKNKELQVMFEAARTTCSDARNLVDYRKGKDLYGKKSLKVDVSNYNKLSTMAWT